MDFLYRTASPSYRGCEAQPTPARTGFFAGLWCSLFGSATPTYRTKGTTGAPASAAPRCFWEAFPATPSYQTPPPAPSSRSDLDLRPFSLINPRLRDRPAMKGMPWRSEKPRLAPFFLEISRSSANGAHLLRSAKCPS